jgi:hypothetical protein
MSLKSKFGFKPTAEQTLSWMINTNYEALQKDNEKKEN